MPFQGVYDSSKEKFCELEILDRGWLQYKMQTDFHFSKKIGVVISPFTKIHQHEKLG